MTIIVGTVARPKEATKEDTFDGHKHRVGGQHACMHILSVSLPLYLCQFLSVPLSLHFLPPPSPSCRNSNLSKLL